MNIKILKAVFAATLIVCTLMTACAPAADNTESSDIVPGTFSNLIVENEASASSDQETADIYSLQVGSEDLYFEMSSLTSTYGESNESTGTLKPGNQGSASENTAASAS